MRFNLILLFWVISNVATISISSGETVASCKAAVSKKSKLSSDPLIDDKSLVLAAHSIRNRSDKIDPVNDHIPELVAPVQQVAQQIRLALSEKTHEKLYKTRKPMLDFVVHEIESRVASDRVTYEFSAVLPIRVGWLLKMSEKDPNQRNQPIPIIETSYYYFSRTYQAHENFMEALVKINKYIPAKSRNGYPNRFPLFKTFYEELKSFPRLIFIPAFLDLSIPELNKLMALKTFPLGNIRQAIGMSKLDGIFFDEWMFPLHDWSHASNIKESPESGTLTEKIVGPIEIHSLSLANRQTEHRYELWHVFHFLLFHEGIRYDYIDLDFNGLSHHYKERLNYGLEKMLKGNYEDELFSRQFLALPSDQRVSLFKTESVKYLELLQEHLNSNKKTLEAEIESIKSLSGN
ncbi:MAG: hypothetical protein ACK5V3_07230 [Bdellovibrionales bacterium]